MLVMASGPPLARAQSDAVLQAVRELAVIATQPEPDRHAVGIAQRVGAAVREWDRGITSLEDRVDRELAGASDARAYQLHLELGMAYRGRGRWRDAVREFDAAAALRPGGSDLQTLRALALEAAGRFEDAAKSFRLAWRFAPRNPVTAYSLLQRGAGEPSDRMAAHAVLADVYSRLVRGTQTTPSAVFPISGILPDTLARTPVIANPMLADVFVMLHAYKLSDASAAPTRAPATVRDSDSARAHFNRGKSHEQANRVGDARREYEAALSGTLIGRHVLYVALGRLALVDGDPAGAVDALMHAVRLAPNDPAIHTELAGAYAVQGLVDEAFRELVAALLIDPGDVHAYAAVGQLRLDAGADEEAVVAFSRALELMPERYEMRFGLATALTRLGRTSEAARQLERFERDRIETEEQRRREIAKDVEQQESMRSGARTQDGGR